MPLAQSRALDQALRKAGVQSTLHVIEGADHIAPGFDSPEVWQMIERFFDWHLKDLQPCGVPATRAAPSPPVGDIRGDE